MRNDINDDLVSVIMPAYNSEKYIGEAIESVLNQSYKNWELIIVNDASSDNTESIIKEYAAKNNKIVLISLTENKGVANARNIAIQNARGRFVAFLDSDDIWANEKLAKQISYMKENSYCFTYHNYILFNTAIGKEFGKVIKVPNRLDYNELLKGNCTGSCLTTVIDRNFIKKIHMPNQRHEDYVCWLNIFKEYNVQAYGVNEMLGYYRVGKSSISSNKLRSAYWTWKVYRDSQKIGFLDAVFYFFNYAIKGVLKYK
ncbi:MAG: glycosyltransferase family 2 protein [Phascolarctobacterium sp.]|nr:glycosyltransferase family 2 protein [Phascolarctobacterium sp.]